MTDGPFDLDDSDLFDPFDEVEKEQAREGYFPSIDEEQLENADFAQDDAEANIDRDLG